MYPKLEWQIKEVETTKKYTKGEGENLKNILENNYETKNTSR